MGTKLRNVVIVVGLFGAFTGGTVSAQAMSLYHPSIHVSCLDRHGSKFCRAVMHRKAIRKVRHLEALQVRRTHARVKLAKHLPGWNVAKLWRANRWERHRLRTLQSMPTWVPTEPVPLGHMLAAEAGWTDSNGEWSCLYSLWNRESGWSTPDTNPSSGAAGIPQALPPSKMGPGWETNIGQQIRWGISYIKNRYGDACSAWAHSNSVSWY